MYGIVVGGMFYSGPICRRLRNTVANGVYSMDMSADDFETTLTPANLSDASKFFRKTHRMKVIKGVSFHDGIIPENPVSFKTIPVKVIDPTYDEMEEVEVVEYVLNSFYFLQAIESPKTYILMELKESLAGKTPKDSKEFKGITPEMRIAYAFHLIERKRKEQEEPSNAVKMMMEETGATVLKVTSTNRGFEVLWGFDRHQLLTIFDKQLRVVNAGYCVNHLDKVMSPRSVVNVLKDGIRDGESINRTTSVDGDFGDGHDRDFEDDEDF
jgi:hypothetical protein